MKTEEMKTGKRGRESKREKKRREEGGRDGWEGECLDG